MLTILRRSLSSGSCSNNLDNIRISSRCSVGKDKEKKNSPNFVKIGERYYNKDAILTIAESGMGNSRCIYLLLKGVTNQKHQVYGQDISKSLANFMNHIKSYDK